MLLYFLYGAVGICLGAGNLEAMFIMQDEFNVVAATLQIIQTGRLVPSLLRPVLGSHVDGLGTAEPMLRTGLVILFVSTAALYSRYTTPSLVTFGTMLMARSLGALICDVGLSFVMLASIDRRHKGQVQSRCKAAHATGAFGGMLLSLLTSRDGTGVPPRTTYATIAAVAAGTWVLLKFRGHVLPTKPPPQEASPKIMFPVGTIRLITMWGIFVMSTGVCVEGAFDFYITKPAADGGGGISPSHIVIVMFAAELSAAIGAVVFSKFVPYTRTETLPNIAHLMAATSATLQMTIVRTQGAPRIAPPLVSVIIVGILRTVAYNILELQFIVEISERAREEHATTILNGALALVILMGVVCNFFGAWVEALSGVGLDGDFSPLRLLHASDAAYTLLLSVPTTLFIGHIISKRKLTELSRDN